MAISPVSSVSFRNNYGQVNFEGRKEKSEYHSSSFTNTLRSIPLATLIALSPLNTTQAQTTAPQEEIVYLQNIDDSLNGSGAVNVWFISTDGDNSNAEKVKFVATEKKYASNRQKEYVTIRQCEPKVLKKVRVTVKDDYSDHVVTRYYVSGPGKTDKIINKMNPSSDIGTQISKKTYKYDEQEIKISEDVYNYLKDVMNDEVKYVNETRTEDNRSAAGSVMEGVFD